MDQAKVPLVCVAVLRDARASRGWSEKYLGRPTRWRQINEATLDGRWMGSFVPVPGDDRPRCTD